MHWQPLARFRDAAVPKLNNLRRAAAAGLRVPPTCWAAAASLSAAPPPPPELGGGPLILRSGSPTEDQRTTSNAGQLLSLPVRDRAAFADSLNCVVAALPRDADGKPRGAVFVQPLVEAEEAGVAFYDGFYYEQTRAVGGNEGLTSGQVRGEVRRGQRARGEHWSEWLDAVYTVFGGGQGGDPRIDVEYARDPRGYVLLQVRPALFPLQRNLTLTLANHKETLGEAPSPWIVSALVEAGRDPEFLARMNPAYRRWEEPYAVELAGQAWLNLSLWARWMDHFGLPRTLATAGVGGDLGSPADARPLWGRFLRSVPRLLWQQVLSVSKAREADRGLRDLDAQIDHARSLSDLYDAVVVGLVLALNTNFAISAVCSALGGVRRALGIPGAARLVTQEMMEEYSRLTALPDVEARMSGLDAWLARYGHRGPLESDLARPRFAELRDVLRADLTAAPASTPRLVEKPSRRGGVARWLSWMDERREWFRDATMRRWQRLRGRILEEGQRLVAAGQLDRPEDVFWLLGDDLGGTTPLREAVSAARARAELLHGVALPLTATREEIETLVAQAGRAQAEAEGRTLFPGIALGPAVVEGRAIKADDLTALLTAGGLGPDVILVVPSLEPSWAVVFPRVGGVVAEVGGELSHASILLREAGRPAVVNCAGIFRQVETGDRLRLDGTRAVVEILVRKDGRL
jgi:phosphohistidine swiveling domain-containing protein